VEVDEAAGLDLADLVDRAIDAAGRELTHPRSIARWS